MAKPIDSFSKEYAFLSNFYASPIISQGLLMPTVEHAFQAYKFKSAEYRKEISLVPFPNQAKKMGQAEGLREDWDEIKRKIMLKLVRRKFKIPALQQALVDTGKAELVEGNYWNDTFWGVFKGEGKNHLGKILMKVRKELQNE